MDSLQLQMKPITSDIFYNNKKIEGKGASANVYKGYNRKKAKIIAIKFIDKSVMGENIAYFQRQAKILQSITSLQHPNIIEYYGFHQNEKGIYIFCEFCGAGDLSTHIKKGISQTKAMVIFQKILEGMIFLSSRNMLHRDLKPKNILLTEDENVKIGDFGSARLIGPYMTAGKHRGSPLYSPPQFYLSPYNNIYDERCDVWSLGLIFYEMLTSSHLFFHTENKSWSTFNEEDLERGMKRFEDSSFAFKMPLALNQQWGPFIREMLTFDYHKRPNFQQIKLKFNTLKVQIMKGYDSLPNILQKSANVLQYVNPYSIEKQTALVTSDMVEKGYQKEQEIEASYRALDSVIKYLFYCNHKNALLIKLTQKFRQAYNLLENVHKWMMMFLCTSIYLLRAKTLMKQLSQYKIQANGKIIQKQTFTSEHLNVFINIAKQSRKQIENQLSQQQQIFNKIVNKLTLDYKGRKKQEALIKENQIVSLLLEKAKDLQFTSDQIYLKQYGLMAKKHSIIAETNYKLLSDEELKTYALIHLIARIDVKFPANESANNDEIQQQWENIERNRESTLMFLRELLH